MKVSGYDHPSLRYFIGDVRDLQRLRRAFQGVDLLVHSAALKQVPACEYNPSEAVSTNVDGTRNVIDDALDAGVHRVMAISTDKAVSPTRHASHRRCRDLGRAGRKKAEREFGLDRLIDNTLLAYGRLGWRRNRLRPDGVVIGAGR